MMEKHELETAARFFRGKDALPVNDEDSPFSFISLEGGDFLGADLRGANLSWPRLRRADLRGADLRGANLSWANLEEADLFAANLQGANLSHAFLDRANLRLAQVYGTSFFNASMERANLSEIFFSRTDLRGADLSFADLRHTSFENIRMSWNARELAAVRIKHAASMSNKPVLNTVAADYILRHDTWCWRDLIVNCPPELEIVLKWTLQIVKSWETKASPMPRRLKEAIVEAELRLSGKKS